MEANIICSGVRSPAFMNSIHIIVSALFEGSSDVFLFSIIRFCILEILLNHPYFGSARHFIESERIHWISSLFWVRRVPSTPVRPLRSLTPAFRESNVHNWRCCLWPSEHHSIRKKIQHWSHFRKGECINDNRTLNIWFVNWKKKMFLFCTMKLQVGLTKFVLVSINIPN